MSANPETKQDPAVARDGESTGNPKGKDPKPQPQAIHNDSTPEKAKSTYTEMATSAANSATSAAVGVKDNVFSMFGGGAKKEKKVEPEDDFHEASGSSKAQKSAEAEAEPDGEVGSIFQTKFSLFKPLILIQRTRTRRRNLQMFISSQSFV